MTDDPCDDPDQLSSEEDEAVRLVLEVAADAVFALERFLRAADRNRVLVPLDKRVEIEGVIAEWRAACARVGLRVDRETRH